MKIYDLLLENVHDPKIDWGKFKLALAAHAAAQNLEGYGKIDAIMFLGLAGDPNSQSVLDVKLKGPARIGVADANSVRDLDFVDPNRKGRIAGEYFGVVYQGKGGQGYQTRKEYEYGIIINHEFFNQATGEIDTSTLAHEAQHRGFDILTRIPAIRNAINPRTQKYLDYLNTDGEKIPGLGLQNTGERNFLEHLLIYSFEAPDQIGDGSSGTDMFRSKAEVKMFQMMYQDIEKAANAYIQRYPVPKGGLELLRKEVDRLTPGDVKINVVPDANGKPIITGFLDKVVNAVKQGASSAVDAVKQGATSAVNAVAQGTDKVKSALDIGTTPAKPSSSKKPDEVSWYDSLLDRIKKNAGLSSKNYVVKNGDTLRKIAQQNNVSIEALIKANPQIKNPDAIFTGDELVIP